MTQSKACLFIIGLIMSVSASAQCLQEFGNSKGKHIYFTENMGQVTDQFHQLRPDVLFTGESEGLSFHIRKNGISYQTYQIETLKKSPSFGIDEEDELVPDRMYVHRTDINWIGANHDFNIEYGESRPGYSNYYLSHCPDGILGVKSFEKIIFGNIYPGIDLQWHEREGILEYDYIVSPQVDYRQIRWKIEGAQELYVNQHGQLVIRMDCGEIVENKPIATQNDKSVAINWALNCNEVGFEVTDYDENLPLVIDPVVRLWGTYYGGSQKEDGYASTVDASSNIYLLGNTASKTGIATSGSHRDTLINNQDVFLAKFNSNGVRQWATYFGGYSDDFGYSCITDESLNVFIAGSTKSASGISTSGSHQSAYGGGYSDVYLAKFNSSGIRQWGTYYGGALSESYGYCTLDKSSNIYLTGSTLSNVGIATSGSHQDTKPGALNISDAFLAKFGTNGVRIWGTYYGGTDNDYGNKCAVDNSNNVYLVGSAYSTNLISTSGSHQNVQAGNKDGFVAKFNGNGVRQWASYYGGPDFDQFNSCVVDQSSNVYIAGYTKSVSGIATSGSYQSSYIGTGDGFLVKFNPDGIRQWGTYYSGNLGATIYGLSIDLSSRLCIVGSTYSTSDIATQSAYQTTHAGEADAYFAIFNSNGERIVASYYGGTEIDEGYFCWLDESTNLYMSGYTVSSNGIASIGAHQTTYGGGQDAFLVKFKLDDYLSVGEDLSDQQIHCYPNPTKDKVYIKFDEPNSDISIEIYDVKGQKVNSKLFYNTSLVLFDLEGPKGIYCLKVVADHTQSVVKIVKE